MQPSMPPAPDAAMPPVPPVQPVGDATAVPPQVAAAPQPAAVPMPTNDGGLPAIADDGDLIEKEWVMHVKQVLRMTAHDPYEQNRQLAILKADYLQKRYGKNIKLSE